jgi:3-isopropylmalate dehydrogenase
MGDDYALFEPTHGSAPKYAGQYKVNSTAMILASKLMLEWLGELESAKKVETGVAAVIEEGKVRTYDMGGTSSTLDVANEVVMKMV